VNEKDANRGRSTVTKSSWVSMAIVVGMGLWLFSGDFTAETADAAEPSQRLDSVSQKVLVQGLQSKAAQRAVEIEVLGKTEANRQVFVRAELSGAITEVNAERGEFIEAGEALCKIAVDNREVRVQEAEAAYQSAMIEYQGALDLSASGLQSKVMLAKLKAAAVQAKSSLQTAKLNLDKTIIRAPFSGFVEDRQVEVGDLVTPGTACASILEISPLLVVGQVSEREVAFLEEGQHVGVHMGQGASMTPKLEGLISFVARTPDAATRSYRVEARLENLGGASRAGLTAKMRIPVSEALAHLISPASLTLNAEGVLGVKTVSEAGTVEFVPVNAVGEDPAGLWVTGLPSEATVITVGHQEVIPGQAVDVELTQSADSARLI